MISLYFSWPALNLRLSKHLNIFHCGTSQRLTTKIYFQVCLFHVCKDHFFKCNYLQSGLCNYILFKFTLMLVAVRCFESIDVMCVMCKKLLGKLHFKSCKTYAYDTNLNNCFFYCAI